jgi:hypothetical protein
LMYVCQLFFPKGEGDPNFRVTVINVPGISSSQS